MQINAQKLCVIFYHLMVKLIISRVHGKVYKLKIPLPVLIQLLKELCHEKGILAAGYAHGYPVSGLYKLIFIDRLGKP